MDLREVGILDAESHWYYLSKLNIIQSEVTRWVSQDLRILDIGAGDGFFSKQLLKQRRGTANCVDINYIHPREEGPILFSTKAEFLDPNLILFIDVLEHVSDPKFELNNILRKIKSKCTVVITVPAFQSLWSPHDEFLGHFGRFRIEEVEKWINQIDGDTEILKKHYLYSLIFPLVFVYRAFRKESKSDLKEVPRFVNVFLRRISELDNRYIRNRLFGLSVFLVFSFTPTKTP
jgi:hypothetical protein